MAKLKFLMVRVNEADRADFYATQSAGGWKDMSAMVRDLVAQARLKQPQMQNVQPLPDLQQDAPAL